MDLFEIIKNRRSIRRYLSEEIPLDDIKTLIEAARWAPSAGNLQHWEFVIVRDSVLKEKIAEAVYGQYWMTEAPVLIVACADVSRAASVYGERGEKLYCIQDVAAAIQNILLMAYSMSYGSCWVGAFDEREVSEILSLPRNIRPLAIISIGKPAEKPSPRWRRPIEEIIHYEQW